MTESAENRVLETIMLPGLQAQLPSVPLNILEIVAKQDGLALGWVVNLLSQLDGDIKVEVRRAAISQVAGMFRYAYAIDRVRERDYDEIEEYLGQLLRATYE